MGLLAPVVGRLYDRFGPRPLVTPGAAVVTLVMWGMTFFGTDTPIGYVVAAHVALSAGLGFMFTPLLTGALGSLKPSLYSYGSAVVGTVQQVADLYRAGSELVRITVNTEQAAAAVPATPDCTVCT